VTPAEIKASFEPCPGCGRARNVCPAWGDECWRDNGCPQSPPDRVPIAPRFNPFHAGCTLSWREGAGLPTPRLARVWPYKQPALYYPKGDKPGGLTVVKFLDY
jgi:hypothetical protein